MREKLIELIAEGRELCEQIQCEGCTRSCKGLNDCIAKVQADHLLVNGVIVPPCKEGDVVYRVCKQKYPVDSYRMQWEEDWVILTRPFDLSMIPEIGKTVFLTRKEAEQALKGEHHAEIH